MGSRKPKSTCPSASCFPGHKKTPASRGSSNPKALLGSVIARQDLDIFVAEALGLGAHDHVLTLARAVLLQLLVQIGGPLTVNVREGRGRAFAVQAVAGEAALFLSEGGAL